MEFASTQFGWRRLRASNEYMETTSCINRLIDREQPAWNIKPAVVSSRPRIISDSVSFFTANRGETRLV